jgi:VWFA-related protein
MKYALVSSLLLAAVSAPLAQQPPITRTTTTGVLIDVTVVDRNGRPVLDLRPEEFELSEDGKRQQLAAVSLVHDGVSRPAASSIVSTAPARPAAATAPAADAAPTTEALPDDTPIVTAILFDRLTPEIRPLAHRAAQAHVASMSLPSDYAGVFLADTSLRTFASFTNDTEALRTAVDRLGVTPAANVSPEAERATYGLVQNAPVDPNQPVTPSAESGAGWINPAERQKLLGKADGPQAGQIGLLRMQLRMLETFRPLLEEFHGHASLAALRAVVGGMAMLPGRKSILYFSEALPLTDAVKPKFEALIQEANRNNITFYAIDAAGLRVHSEQARLARNVDLAGAQGIGDVQRDGGAWTKDIERQSDLLSSRISLGRLAKETGGFLVDNTNDLAKGFARMQQERTTYYLLGYQPTNTGADGKFRRVTVKVKRPRMTVRARPGYVAAKQP